MRVHAAVVDVPVLGRVVSSKVRLVSQAKRLMFSLAVVALVMSNSHLPGVAVPPALVRTLLAMVIEASLVKPKVVHFAAPVGPVTVQVDLPAATVGVVQLIE